METTDTEALPPLMYHEQLLARIDTHGAIRSYQNRTDTTRAQAVAKVRDYLASKGML